MIDSFHDAFHSDDSIGDVEALILAAGNYVQPTEDLRPRVIEAVRSRRVERRVQWRLAQAAMLFVVFNLLATSTLQQVEVVEVRPQALAPSGSAPFVAPPYQDRDDWDTVDSFRELRRRQASLLRLHL